MLGALTFEGCGFAAGLPFLIWARRAPRDEHLPYYGRYGFFEVGLLVMTGQLGKLGVAPS
jgi:hypothetical protein